MPWSHAGDQGIAAYLGLGLEDGMSDWDTILGEGALGRDLVPLDRVRGAPGSPSGQRPPGLTLLEQPRAKPADLASTHPETIFRQEALAFRTRGQDAPSGVVRLGARWIGWIYRLTLVLLVAVVASLWLVHTDETSSGPAVIDGRARTVSILLPVAIDANLTQARAFSVSLPSGQTVQITGIHAVLAGDAAVRRAGFTPPDQPALLVTGTLVTGSGAAPGPGHTQATIVLRSESLAEVLARQFRSMLGQGAAP
jgi:hypothetical protein